MKRNADTRVSPISSTRRACFAEYGLKMRKKNSANTATVPMTSSAMTHGAAQSAAMRYALTPTTATLTPAINQNTPAMANSVFVLTSNTHSPRFPAPLPQR